MKTLQHYVYFILSILLLLGSLYSCTGKKRSDRPEKDSGHAEHITDDSLFNLVQYKTFQYFWDGAEPTSGMARERFHVDGVYPQNDKNVVTIGGSGFGVMAILVGIERGYITRNEGFERLQKIVTFLEKADRFHGIWPHWLEGETGKVRPFSPKDDGADAVESAFMFQGLLTVRQYFKEGTAAERELAAKIDQLWREAEWSWFTKGENTLFWHWSPNYEWEMDFRINGYNECLIYYFLAAASPTYPINKEVYDSGWARNGDIQTTASAYNYPLLLKHNYAEQYGGPLFWAHYSYLGLDPRELQDEYVNYWELNKNHTLINRQWCVENTGNYKGYGDQSWGLTSSYSYTEDGGVGYSGHKPGEDKGVISPTAALSSFPYTPEYSMEAMKYFYYTLGDRLMGPYGFYDAFSEEMDWFPKRYLAIDQGPIVVMMENHRSQLLWNLFMSCPEVQQAKEVLAFN